MNLDQLITFQKPDDGPLIVEVVNEEIFQALDSAECQTLSPGIDEETGRILANILHNAGLELRATVRFYKNYAPVAVITPVPKSDWLETFPAELVVELNEAQSRAVTEFKIGVEPLSVAAKESLQAFSEVSQKVNWSLASLILGRVGMYKDLITDTIKNGEIVKLKNVSLSLFGQVFALADFSLKEAGVDSAWAKTIVSCGATVVTGAAIASTLSTGGLAAIGFFTIVDVAGFFPDAIECGKHFKHIGEHVWSKAQETYEKLIVVQVYSTDRPGNNFRENDDGSVDIFDRMERVNSCSASNLRDSFGTVHESTNGDVGDWKRDCHDWGFECDFERENDNPDVDDPDGIIHGEHRIDWESPIVEIKLL